MYSEMGEWRKSLRTIEQALLAERALIRRGPGQGTIYSYLWQGIHRMVTMARGGNDDGVTAPRVLPSVLLDRIIRLSQVAHRTKGVTKMNRSGLNVPGVTLASKAWWRR